MAEAAWGLWAVIAIALIFDYINGMHDAANAIATVVSTRVLSPRQAILLSACLNFAGAFLSTAVAKTIGKGIVDPAMVTQGLVAAAMLGAIGWNLLTWYYGIPSSSSHALIGGLVGAALASGELVQWLGVREKVLIPMVISPLIGISAAFALTLSLQWIFRNARKAQVGKGFRGAQIFAAGSMSVGHGLQDAQKTMGVITLSLVVGGMHTGDSIPIWVKVAAAAAISLGTYAGGWRIMKTLGHRMIEVDQVKGLASTTVASSVLYIMAIHFKAPISTTHTITSSILGAGATRGRKWVRWGVVGNIATAWILTLPAAAACAAIAYKLISLFGGN